MMNVFFQTKPRDIPIYTEEDRKIVHVLVGHSCNNNCVFCFEDDRKGRYRYVTGQRNEDIKKIISLNNDASEILFTCGEPTLNRDLPEFIRLARESGIKTISIITNGRRFAYKNYAEFILRTGINSVTVSIHGHCARLHDALTRTKGSFEQTFSGIRNFCELKGKYDFSLKTSTVINKKNGRRIADIYRFISLLPVDKIIFNMMLPDGRGERYFRKLMPRFKDVVRNVQELLQHVSGNDLYRIILVDFPYCVTEGLPDGLRGHIEKFVQYEPLGTTGHGKIGEDTLKRKISSLKAENKPVKKADRGASLDGFYITSRELKESFFRVKREECVHCLYDNLCPGVWDSYVCHFGWDEFVPVKAKV